MQCPARASSSVDVQSRLPTGVGKHAPVQMRPGRPTGLSATPEGSRAMEVEVPPAVGDLGQLRPEMTA
eukprot:1695212-Pleurochrysis_carterae.AAC.1